MKPILLELGPLTVRTWGVMVALAFLASMTYVIREASKKGIERDKIINLAFFMLISGMIGARIVFVLTQPSYYIQHPAEIFMIHQGGLAIHGGVLGGAIATYFFAKRNKISFIGIADILAPALILGQGIGRLGCFFAGLCYGKETDFLIRFKFFGVEGLRHPTQLYESGLDFLAFGLLIMFQDRFKKKGVLFATSVIVYSAIRFMTEIIRDSMVIAYGITYAQAASAVIIIIFGTYLVKTLKTPDSTLQ
ncbi:MAG TPA: prolipoprotein diacylglyceryl transferase [Actinobacteria bacterium]|nr:prolipoprotein diacylglyceryl transferase [Actinomycetota bacterium]